MQRLIYQKRLYERWLRKYAIKFLHQKEKQNIEKKLDNVPLSWFENSNFTELTKRILNIKTNTINT